MSLLFCFFIIAATILTSSQCSPIDEIVSHGDTAIAHRTNFASLSDEISQVDSKGKEVMREHFSDDDDEDECIQEGKDPLTPRPRRGQAPAPELFVRVESASDAILRMMTLRRNQAAIYVYKNSLAKAIDFVREIHAAYQHGPRRWGDQKITVRMLETRDDEGSERMTVVVKLIPTSPDQKERGGCLHFMVVLGRLLQYGCSILCD